MKEQEVSVGRLKARLSEYLRRASAGVPILITTRGRPVARLVPLVGPAARQGRMESLVRDGLVRPPQKEMDLDLVLRPGPADPTSRAVASILEERAEGW